MKNKYTFFILAVMSLLKVICFASAEDQIPGSVLSIDIPMPGTVILDGDISSGEEIRLYSREYQSAEHMITDNLLVDTTAEQDRIAKINYDRYAEPLVSIQITPDFEYNGREITIKALYAVVSDGVSEVRSDLAYTECYLDTGVVNQYWCRLAGSTACGTAAGAITMQISYPSSGDDLFSRVNEMRNYCTLGDEFSTGPSEYYLCGDHISNSVNKFVSEELSGSLVMTDHRTEDETTEETLIRLLTTGRPAVIEVCYLLGAVTRDFQGISHWITINGFTMDETGYTFRFADPITVSYRSITSETLEVSNANVSYGDSGYMPVRYIGAFSKPLFCIE